VHKVETEQESDSRWIAEVRDRPGALTYGVTREEAVRRAQALSLRIIGECLQHGKLVPDVQAVFKIVE
jgi:predicted RNase H-like HicB family nuclease